MANEREMPDPREEARYILEILEYKRAQGEFYADVLPRLVRSLMARCYQYAATQIECEECFAQDTLERLAQDIEQQK